MEWLGLALILCGYAASMWVGYLIGRMRRPQPNTDLRAGDIQAILTLRDELSPKLKKAADALERIGSRERV